ncbi:MAG TPA: endonuclease MutS2 [Ktedonobacterales bacterium]|jgi:DNA mismatch repair protein MutS2
MHEKSVGTLEFPKILERLAHEAAFSASKALARALQPSDDLDEVKQRQAYTSEARRLLELRPDAGVRGARDIRPTVLRAERGAMLLPNELLEVLATVRSSIYVGRLLEKVEGELPLLKALGADLPQRPKLVERIEESISEDGEVLDSASPLLRRLRADIRGAQQRLQEKLQSLVNELRPALQDAIITTRSDRYVLPVRAEARGQVRGIVHDQSSSGATVFVEPLVIVEMNNKLRELHLAERQEVERILTELSEAIGKEALALNLDVQLLAEIDLALAKARYSELTNSNPPHLNDKGRVKLLAARHPLLTGKVVPTDFHLGDTDFSMVVITGPNTGGKTVALKTVGLLTLMAQAGLHIPADDRSEINVFADVFADIGDEQSIEQSLSTFSSHLSRIIDILKQAGPKSLVLLDELGAGTDPSEGSALARAILMHLLAKHVCVVATTHYSELKAFAYDTAGVANASVEFDVETLSPTYRLQIGLPGRSNALAIASRLGLPQDIIEQARQLLGTTGVQMESLLEGLQADRRAAADERYHLSMERAEAEHLRKQLQTERAKFEEDRARILNEARAQARRELEQVQRQLDQMRVDMNRRRVDLEKVERMRARVSGMEGRLAPVPEPKRRAVQPAAEEAAVSGPLEVGDTVLVRSLNQRGELVSLPDSKGEVEVQLGLLKVRVLLENIERLSKRQARAEEPRTSRASLPGISLPDLGAREVPDMQLDLRGKRVEEVLERVDQYLHDAYMVGMPFVRLLHGKGTGALRQAIREQLAHHPLVRSFAPAAANDGGEGITVVTLSQS